MIAELRERFNGVEIHVGLRVVVGEVGAVLVFPELGARLDLQTVAGDVLGLEIDDVAQRLHPLLAALVRKAVHEIDGDVVKARAARHHDRLLRLTVVVRAAERLELLVGVGLHADGDAVEARAVEAREHGKRDRVGICLKRHLGVAADVKATVDLGEDAAQAAGSEERGRAAAEVDGVDLVPLRAGRGLADVGENGGQIPVHQLLVARAAEGVEVAVFALAAAERHMDVDAERLFLFILVVLGFQKHGLLLRSIIRQA